MKKATSRTKTQVMEVDKTKVSAFLALIVGFLMLLFSLYNMREMNESEDRVKDALRANQIRVDSMHIEQRKEATFRDSIFAERFKDKSEDIRLINTNKNLLYDYNSKVNDNNALPIDGVSIQLRGAVNRTYCCP